MHTTISSLTQIPKLQAEIMEISAEAVIALTQRRKVIEHELSEIDSQLLQLNGKPKERKPKFPTPARLVSLAELKSMLAA